MLSTKPHANGLGWLLDQRLGTLPGVHGAVLVSADGLLHSRTSSLDQETAEARSAVAATLKGAARAYSESFGGGGVRQILLELVNHVALITETGENVLLLVQTTGPDADISAVAHQAAELAVSVGKHMAVEARGPAAEEQATG